MRRAALIILVALVSAGAAIGATRVDPWGDRTANDVLVPQDAVVEVLTADRNSSNKNFKYSFTRPFEIWPGRFCVIVQADVHSDYVGNFPVLECFDYGENPTRLGVYVSTKALTLTEVERLMGKSVADQKNVSK